MMTEREKLRRKAEAFSRGREKLLKARLDEAQRLFNQFQTDLAELGLELTPVVEIEGTGQIRAAHRFVPKS